MVEKKPQMREALQDIKPYVPGKPVEEVERELGLKDVLKLASNENPLGPSPLGLEALQEAACKVSYYPDGYCFYLRRALAARLGVREDNLIIGNGSDEILKLLAEAFVRPGEEAVMASPSFSEYEFATQLMGGCPVPVPSRALYHDIDAMLAAVNERTRLFFICNPNNPTGTIVPARDVERVLDELPPGVLVVLDEAYYEYVDDPAYPQSIKYVLQGRDNVIVLRTFSKIYGLAGLRVGYGVAVPELVAMVSRTREPFNVNLLAQAAARAALDDTAHLERSRQVNAEGKQYLYGEFARMKLEYVPTQANFVFVNLGVDSREVFTRMLKKGVIIRTGDIFGLPTWMRVTIGTPEQNRRMIQALGEVLADLGVQ